VLKDNSLSKWLIAEVYCSIVDLISNIKKECSWSPANDSDDSDIENFDDTVSDDGL